jgi:hypothetical protein
MSIEEVDFSETEIGHMLRGFERTSQVPMTWGPSCKQSGHSESRARERERDRERQICRAEKSSLKQMQQFFDS